MKRKELLFVAIVALLAIGGMTACAWLAQPLEPDPAPHHAEAPSETPKTNIDVGGGVSISAPAPSTAPVTIPVGEGAAITIGPPPSTHAPTNGDAVAQAVGGLAQVYGAGPMGGVLIAAALTNLFGALAKRK